MRLQRLLLVLWTLFVALAPALTCAAACPDRVVAVGDVHGDFDGLVAILGAAGLVDAEQRWSGGDTTLVQIGDLLDRGPDVRAVMDLLMRLQRESEAAGGRVVCLVGNHEAMNLFGILRDVNPEAFAQFADRKSESRRQSAWKRQARLWQRRAERDGRVMVGIPEETRAGWLAAFPLGALEYLQALAPTGDYGRWLRSFPVAVMVGDTLFVHGGLSPRLQGMDVAALNRQVAAELAAFDAARDALVKRELVLPWAPLDEVALVALAEVERRSAELDQSRRPSVTSAADVEALEALRGWGDWLLVAQDGPVWTRAAAQWDEHERGAEMVALVAGAGASRMVVGHTVQPGASIQARFDDRVFLVDTGMLASHYRGRPSALEICGEAVTAVYLGERHELVPPGAAAAAVGEEEAADGDRGDSPPAAGVDESQNDGPSARAPQAQGHRWLDVDGAPLPFQSDAEVEEFLATAEVVSRRDIPVGITRPLKLVLERDGVRAHAAFKHLDERRKHVSLEIGGRRWLFPTFRDYHGFDCAAYRLDRLFGLGRVPPAVERTVGKQSGTVKLWLEETITSLELKKLELVPPDPARLALQSQVMFVFDNVAGNADSGNLGNALYDRQWNLWFVDCSRCFVTEPTPLTLKSVVRCERRLWERLNAVTDEEIRVALGPYLRETELRALLKRKAAVVRHITRLVEKRGEASVLFDLAPPHPDPADW